MWRNVSEGKLGLLQACTKVQHASFWLYSKFKYVVDEYDHFCVCFFPTSFYRFVCYNLALVVNQEKVEEEAEKTYQLLVTLGPTKLDGFHYFQFRGREF